MGITFGVFDGELFSCLVCFDWFGFGGVFVNLGCWLCTLIVVIGVVRLFCSYVMGFILLFMIDI